MAWLRLSVLSCTWLGLGLGGLGLGLRLGLGLGPGLDQVQLGAVRLKSSSAAVRGSEAGAAERGS